MYVYDKNAHIHFLVSILYTSSTTGSAVVYVWLGIVIDCKLEHWTPDHWVPDSKPRVFKVWGTFILHLISRRRVRRS